MKEFDYVQYSNSSMMATELALMLSMHFPSDLIHHLSKQPPLVWDLDFIRIIYFMLRDAVFVEERIFARKQIVYEDVLEEAIETAVERKHPEYAEITDGTKHLNKLEELTSLRIRYLEQRNESLEAEISRRKEEKKLTKESAGMDMDDMAEECGRLQKLCEEKDKELAGIKEQIKRLEEEKDSLVRDRENLENAVRDREAALESLRMESSEDKKKRQELEEKLKEAAANAQKQEKHDKSEVVGFDPALIENMGRELVTVPGTVT